MEGVPEGVIGPAQPGSYVGDADFQAKLRKRFEAQQSQEKLWLISSEYPDEQEIVEMRDQLLAQCKNSAEADLIVKLAKAEISSCYKRVFFGFGSTKEKVFDVRTPGEVFAPLVGNDEERYRQLVQQTGPINNPRRRDD